MGILLSNGISPIAATSVVNTVTSFRRSSQTSGDVSWKGEASLGQLWEMCSIRWNVCPIFYVTGGDPILHSHFWEILELLKDRNIPFTISAILFIWLMRFVIVLKNSAAKNTSFRSTECARHMTASANLVLWYDHRKDRRNSTGEHSAPSWPLSPEQISTKYPILST